MNKRYPKIRVLSAGAVEPGLIDATASFSRQTGCEVTIDWATTPMIRERFSAGPMDYPADVLVIPPAAYDDFVAAGHVPAGSSIYLGRVGVGVFVRDGAPLPDVSSTAALKQSLLDFDSIVINRASSGLYMEGLLERLGVKQQIEPKLVRIIDGPQMMQHVMHAKHDRGREFGFCASIEIVLYRGRGITLAGMLPEEVQHYTPYVAAPMKQAWEGGQAAVRALLGFFDSPASRAIFARHGIV